MNLGFIALAGNPIDHILQHPIHTEKADLGPLTPHGEITVFSDHISMLIGAAVLLMLVLPIWGRKRRGSGEIDRLVPTGFGNFIEVVCNYLREEVARPNLGPYTDNFIKYVWTLFFFILTVNLLGLTPIAALSPVTFDGLHIGGTATGNIWVTGTLALFTLLMVVINGLRLAGMDYVKHFNPGPWWLAPLMVPLELFGLLAKAFALAVRLFANMLAGHILLAVLLGFVLTVGSAAGTGAGLGMALVVVPASVAINLLELFVAFLQAFIFTFLTVLFLGMAILPHGPESAHAH